jgi:hypothetical protein
MKVAQTITKIDETYFAGGLSIIDGIAIDKGHKHRIYDIVYLKDQDIRES